MTFAEPYRIFQSTLIEHTSTVEHMLLCNRHYIFISAKQCSLIRDVTTTNSVDLGPNKCPL